MDDVPHLSHQEHSLQASVHSLTQECNIFSSGTWVGAVGAQDHSDGLSPGVGCDFRKKVRELASVRSLPWDFNIQYSLGKGEKPYKGL